MEYIEYAKDRGSTMDRPEDINIEHINVLEGAD
jgi:hypothetical protein